MEAETSRILWAIRLVRDHEPWSTVERAVIDVLLDAPRYLSDAEIADRLKISRDEVVRIRAKLSCRVQDVADLV